MRILSVRTSKGYSGAEIYNFNLSKEFKSYSSLRIDLFTNSETLYKNSLRLNPYSIYDAWMPQEVGTKKQLLQFLFFFPVFYFRYLLIIFSLQRESKLDLICLQSMTEKIFLSIVLKLFGFKIVWIEHGPLFASQMSKVIKWFYLKTYNSATSIIAVSEDTKTDLIRGGVRPDKIKVIYIGVNTAELSPLSKSTIQKQRKAMNVADGVVVFGFLGTVTSEKGIEQYVDTAITLLKKNEKAHFLVIGDGPKLAWAREEVRIKEIGEKFTFTGFTENVKQHLGIVDVLLFPTNHHEGISMALLESQSMGIPVVAKDIGGNKEIITNGVNGFLYKNSSEIEPILEKLVENRLLRKNIGLRARKNIEERFNIQKQAKKFYQLFLDLCNQ